MVKYLKRCLILIGVLFGSTIAVAQATPAYLTQAMTASEAAYAFRKSGFEASPQLIALWTGARRIDWINHTINSLSTDPVTEPPNWTRSQVRHWGLEMMEPGNEINLTPPARTNWISCVDGGCSRWRPRNRLWPSAWWPFGITPLLRHPTRLEAEPMPFGCNTRPSEKTR